MFCSAAIARRLAANETRNVKQARLIAALCAPRPMPVKIKLAFALIARWEICKTLLRVDQTRLEANWVTVTHSAFTRGRILDKCARRDQVLMHCGNESVFRRAITFVLKANTEQFVFANQTASIGLCKNPIR